MSDCDNLMFLIFEGEESPWLQPPPKIPFFRIFVTLCHAVLFIIA